MPNERFGLVSLEKLQEECETKWQCCFLCQKDGESDLQLPASENGICF